MHFFSRCKSRLHELMQLDREFSDEEKNKINPCKSSSISDALDFVKNPVKCCQQVHTLITSLLDIVRLKRDDPKTKGMRHSAAAILPLILLINVASTYM